MSFQIDITKVTTKSDLTAFVKFPFILYKDNPYWVPPIIKEEVDYFNPQKNPAFDQSEVSLFTAIRNNEIVGRVATIINHYEINKLSINKLRFGWFDVVDDVEVSKVLLDKVYSIAKEKKTEYIEGPMGFSNLDKVGVLTKGYEEVSTMITWYNYPYYVEHLEKLGFKKNTEWLEHYFYPNNIRYDYYERMACIIKKRYGLRELQFKSKNDVLPYVHKIFKLFDKTYKSLDSYVPISDRQVDYFKEKYISFIDPEFIKYIEDENGKAIAFAITMPSFSKALQKSKGKLFPFGIWHILKAKRNPTDVLFYLIGIHPDYQKKGVVFVLFDEYGKTYKKKGIKKAIRTPELAKNKDIQAIWKEFNPVNHKTRCTYRKDVVY